MIEHHDAAASEAALKGNNKHRDPDRVPNFRVRWQEKTASLAPPKSKRKVDCGELFWSWASPRKS